MVDQQEIILMTKLALHEKKYGKEDKKRNAYFKWDYIYINNWYTRFAAGAAVAIIVGWMIFTDVYIREIVPVLDVSLNHYLKKYIIFFATVILLYTGISTLIYNKRYEDTKKRLRQYEKIMKGLDDYQDLKQGREEDLDDITKPNIANSRSTY